jgi:hypothetical protein
MGASAMLWTLRRRYKAKGVDMNAINDGLVLECQIYSMLKKHLKAGLVRVERS